MFYEKKYAKICIVQNALPSLHFREINLSRVGLFMRMLNGIVPSHEFYIHITSRWRGWRNAVITRGTSVCKLAPWTINAFNVPHQKLSPIVRAGSMQVRVISRVLLYDTRCFIIFRNILISAQKKFPFNRKIIIIIYNHIAWSNIIIHIHIIIIHITYIFMCI